MKRAWGKLSLSYKENRLYAKILHDKYTVAEFQVATLVATVSAKRDNSIFDWYYMNTSERGNAVAQVIGEYVDARAGGLHLQEGR